MSEVGNVIMAALDAMEDGEKWCTGVFEDPAGRMCATGAVNRALGLSNADGGGCHYGDPQWEAAMRALAAHVPTDANPYVISVIGDRRVVSERPDFLNQPTVAQYNNSRRSFDDIREWFEKTALDEGVTL